VVSTFFLVGVGRALFGAHVGLPITILPFLVAGPALFVSLGLLAGSVSATPETAAVFGNIITFPMMFLSGTFFPVQEFPAWLVPVAHALPLYYVIDGLNAAMLFGNTAQALGDLAVVAGLAGILFVLAVRVFRWRDE
jgi:ABC-2 type transport system permease protein